VLEIVGEGTGTIELEHNSHWLEVTRPMIEAFSHAQYILEMGIRYGKMLEAPPCWPPSGWAASLHLYELR
jgi:hypothetical protein